jgi:hypothetical protein
MESPFQRDGSPGVQVVGPEDGWILERIARRLASKLPYAILTRPGTKPAPHIALVYYVNYYLYNGPSGVLDVGYFTHADEANDFLARGRRMDYCVCMSRVYEDWLKAQGVTHVTCIPMAYDSYRYRPRLVLGVIGLLDQPRKGKHLVDAVRQLPFVEVVTTEGRLPPEQLPDFYQRLDYVLIPATVEGGPMCLLEGLAMGKPVLAPANVGMVPEFGDTEHIRRYPTGDVAGLLELVRTCYEEKRARARLVEERTWDRWAEAHHRLFERLLRERGKEWPQPCPGFRFGMLGELEVPLGVDVEPLETAVDAMARHLYFGRYGEARAGQEAVLPRYPFAGKLLDGIPRDVTPSLAAVGRASEDACTSESTPLGCVLAVQNRSAEYLERTFQTYRYQTYQPVDKVLLDYGSAEEFAAAYRSLADRYGWRYVRSTPAKPGWSLSAAYNLAVSALADSVEVVFKGDVDVLLGADVLATAARFGRDKLCIFSCLSTGPGTAYPSAFQQPGDLEGLLRGPSPPEPMLGEGIHAYPRRWFREIGGFDLAFSAWGFEDSDLRVRAQKSIGLHNDTSALVVHQWHPRSVNEEQAAMNRAHYDRMKVEGNLVRNGGQLVPPVVIARTPLAVPDEAAGRIGGEQKDGLRIAFATRSIQEVLYRLSSALFGLDRLQQQGVHIRQHRLTGTDSTGYCRELLALDADWVVNVDEDAFVLAPERVLDLIGYMERQGFAACGVPDGGVVAIRAHNPVACNAFFNVFDLRRVRRVWQDWPAVLAARHQPAYETAVPAFARRTRFVFDHFEPYYGVFFALLGAGERILYLDAEEWQDGITTLVKDMADEPFLLHCWYSRTWKTNPDTRSRYRLAVEYARWKQGLPRLNWESSAPPAAVSPLGKWEALFQANRDPFPFGDTLTYEKAAAFLDGLTSVEDWGAGQGWFRRYLKPMVRYKSIDGSRSAQLDQLADLATYTSQVEGIMLRHVLEHNDGWAAILSNALCSFTKRLVIILFTPFAERTVRMAYNHTIGVPDIAFAKEDLVRAFDGLPWQLEENVKTKTQYGVEQVFYLEKQ